MMAGPIADLTLLQEVTAQNIIHYLQSNYSQGAIYIYIGDILLVLNPFRLLPIYGPKIGFQYCGLRELRDFPPHIYSLAHRVHKNLSSHHAPQCVLLLGESGSGKTESCKMLISQLVRESDKMAGSTGRSLGSKLPDALNILDAFGNASTELNNNASRFSKLIDIIHDENGVIVGAKICAYHLERSRVTCPWEEEQNFNIFYHLLAGLTSSELQHYYLDGTYRIISPIQGRPLYATQDDFDFHKERLEYIKNTITELGINFQLSREGEIYVIFGVLTALLHLGNIEFYADQSGGALIANDQEIGMASSLMNVLPQELTSVLLSSSTYVQGQMVRKMNTESEAVNQRNILIQTIYYKLFDWLIYNINTVLSPGQLNRNDLHTITIVDPPGFEARDQNTLEQLHYNVLAEKLHQFAYSSIFTGEYRDCDHEGVKSTIKVNWNDNRAVLDLLDVQGVLGILDETSRSKTPMDMVFLDKLNKTLGKKKQFVKNKIGTYFTIVHTASTINYAVSDIINKNINRIASSIIGLMSTCQHPLIVQLFSKNGPESQETQTKQFHSSANDIIQQMSGKKLHLIRCIKPNPASVPKYFDQETTMKQLEVASVIELIKIRQKGFPDRISQYDFVHRYKFIAFPITSNPRSLTAAVHKIIRKCGLPESNIHVTNKLVFLQHWHVDRLDRVYSNELHRVVVAQSCVRRHMARKVYKYKMQRLRGDREYMQEFATGAERQGNSTYHLLREQSDHNHNNFQRELQHHYGNLGSFGDSRYAGSRSRQDESDWGDRHYRKNGEVYASVISSSLTDEAAFFQHQLERVVKKRESLETGIWCKLICMEKDKEMAKFLISQKEITIDGSYEEYDENKVGLGVFRNPQRDQETSKIRSVIREGVTLRRDPDGNIWAFRHCHEDIIVNGFRDPANHCISADVIVNKGRLPFRQQIKIFDVKELKAHIGIELQSSMYNKDVLMHQCKSCLSFVTEGRSSLDTPVWLCIINVVALDMLESQEVVREVQSHLTQLKLESTETREMRYEEDKEQQKIKQRHGRQAWSKADKQDQLRSGEDISPSKLRMELRRKGEDIKNHMNYSWDQPFQNKRSQNITVEELQQEYSEDPEADYDGAATFFQRQNSNSNGPGPKSPLRKDWAKIKVSLKKDAAKQETDAAERHSPGMY